jgi:hypothetical protein
MQLCIVYLIKYISVNLVRSLYLLSLSNDSFVLWSNHLSKRFTPAGQLVILMDKLLSVELPLILVRFIA